MFRATFFTFLLSCLFVASCQNDFCDINEREGNCSHNERSPMKVRYIFYDVNPPEGFNLRRDVYMRMAIFAKNLKQQVNSFLVLPPWPHLYHWQSENVIEQSRLPWNMFFDIKSLQEFAPVIEMNKFFQTNINVIDQVYVLQHFEDTFTSNNFKDRMKVEPCQEKLLYKRVKDGYKGYFWGYKNITAKKVDCLSFHGSASQLINIVKEIEARTVMFDHAEVVLHDRFGDKTYWEARKSMRFASHLIDEARRYQRKYLNWTNGLDINPQSNGKKNAIGGNYLCVHLRRKDFLYGHSEEVPSISGAANQIEKALNESGLNVVFVATDAIEEEKTDLKSRLSKRKVLFYTPPKDVAAKWKDGGVAIIEQIICSHARQFIGTHESTFSFRIQEEREILGFKSETTFRRLCGDGKAKCRQPSQWKILH